MQCIQCKKTNPSDSNFCTRCGFTLTKKVKCPICLEIKKNDILICGHTACLDCLNKSYSLKNECPICRAKMFKCEKCNSFRVIENSEKKECLECKHISKKIIKNKKISCIDCNSSRVLFNTNNKWSCLDCFCNFTIINNIASLDNTISSTTKICSLCCSNDIEYKENGFDNKCLNCETTNTKLKHVTLEEYSRLKIKSKEEVKKQVKKYSCSVCKKETVLKMINLNDPLEELFFCRTCNKSGIKVIL